MICSFSFGMATKNVRRLHDSQLAGRTRLTLLVFLLLFVACTDAVLQRDSQTAHPLDGYFPLGEWRTSSPEAQGFDADALVKMFDQIAADHVPIHSLQIVRHGHLIVDAYFFPFQKDRRHDVASVTKSITSSLIGQAIQDGTIANVDAPAWPLLSEQTIDDALKQRIAIHHLLTMSSGLACTKTPYERELLDMLQSRHWADYAMALPMRDSPGARFSYCSPGYHVLSTLLSRATGRSAEEFARDRLFGPLGITDFVWPRDSDGVNHGWGDLQMRPVDMAKLGYLFLRQGEWNGQQVISREWIAKATRRQIRTASGSDYGYGWWISKQFPGMYQAEGRGGQTIIVWPVKDIVLVTTGGGFEFGVLAAMLKRALRTDVALPDNPAGVKRLQKAISIAAESRDTKRTAIPLPTRAAEIDSVVYRIDSNVLGLRSIQLRFNDDSTAAAEIGWRDQALNVPVGVDGAFRFATDPQTDGPVAGRGRWMDTDAFQLEIDTIGGINFFVIQLTFSGNAMTIDLTERSGLIQTKLTGRSNQ